MDTKRILLVLLSSSSLSLAKLQSLEPLLYKTKYQGLKDPDCSPVAFDEDTKQNTTNRCNGVVCKRDDQCNSAYCVTNPPSKQLSPSYTCAAVEYKPACNYSKTFTYFNKDEHINFESSRNICKDVECDWDPDCGKDLFCVLQPYQNFPMCTPNAAQCNNSAEAVIGKDYTTMTVLTDPSTNRCQNVDCQKNSDCAQGKCWNTTYCGGPFCNNSLEYLFFDENDKRQKVPARDLCGGFECLNDDPCYYGCANATECLHYWTTCNNSIIVTVYDEELKDRKNVTAGERCEFTPCMNDQQCAYDNMCFNGTCTRIKSFCNKTSVYQSFDDVKGWSLSVSTNRCYGAKCHADDQCAFDHTNKLQCQNATCGNQQCNLTYLYQYYEDGEQETKLAQTPAINRCSFVLCADNSYCQSGMCSNSTCLSQGQTQPTCNATIVFQSFKDNGQITEYISSSNRCQGITCAVDEDCSGELYCCTADQDCNGQTNMCLVGERKKPDGGNKGLIIGLSIGVAILVLILIAAGFYFYKKRQSEKRFVPLTYDGNESQNNDVRPLNQTDRGSEAH